MDLALRPGRSAAESGGRPPVKKLLLLVLVGVGALAVWRKVQSDRAELDLWTEATTSD
jgi:MYXO-CTERM domain-containing protein